MTPSTPNVVIATPCYGGLVTHVYVHSLLKLMTTPANPGFTVSLLTSAHDSLITRSRNSLIKRFIDTTGATHLMLIDADIGFEPAAVHRLLAFDEDIAAGMYPVKFVDWAKVNAAARAGTTDEALREAGLHYVGVPCTGPEHEERSGFVTGRYAGTGFMMIKRAAVERLIAAYPETKYRTMHTYPLAPQTGAPFHSLFDCIIDPETGVYLSEDFTFCHRFRKIGGKIWLDTESRLRHIGSMEFQGPAVMEMTKYGATFR